MIHLKLRYELIPSNYSNTNQYILNLIFENNDSDQYWIEEVNLINLKDQKILEHSINQVLNGSWFFGLLKPRISVNLNLIIAKNITDPRHFAIRLYVRKIINGKKSKLYYLEWGSIIVQLKLSPIYRAFISRTVRGEESFIPDVISEYIKNWGFEIYTVGIPPLKKQYDDEELLKEILDQIEKSEVVFAIATKRDQMLRNLNWRTFEWLQSETAMAYVLKKIIIVFAEEGVELSGLASKRVNLSFASNQLSNVNSFFDLYMRRIRELIQYKKNTKDLYDFLKGCAYFGGIALIGAVAYLAGKEDQKYIT